MERADHFRIYAPLNRKKILEMLKAHSKKEILPGIMGLQDVFIRSSDSIKRKKQLW